ncbi:COG1361 S-layer family protein [Sulfolobus acidocaldarius]|uniref:COG1361 S-layer family protein n=1 Tax=Sulfolobus acidocaldarius TaxID=2285 RepID=UPI000B5A7043|nr:hypothetical protein [Sulfolobus acidocaldarius]
MKKRVSLILLILSIIVISTSFSYVISTATPNIQGYSSSPELITPGEQEIPITFHLINSNPYVLYNVQISPTDTYPFYLFNYYNVNPTVTIPEWTPGQMVNVTYIFNVANGVKDGIYEELLNIQAIVNNQSIYTQVSVGVPVLGYVNFTASSVWGTPSNPTVVGPGQTNTPLTIILQNLGNALVTNVTLEFSSQFPVKFLQNNATISAIEPGYYGEATVFASVYPNATEGVYYIKLKVNYYQNSVQYVTVPIDIGAVSKVSLTDTWGTPSNPQLAAAGSSFLPLTIYVENLGENLLSNVTLTLKSHYPIQFLQNNATIGFVPAGQYNYATVIASVDRNATPGVYYIPVTVSMYNGYKETVMMPIYVLGYVNFTASSVWGTPSNPTVVGPGQTNTPLTIILQNIGTATVTNATLQLESQYPVKFLQSNLSIGNIPVGVPIELTVLSNVYPNATTGVYFVSAKITYYDGITKNITFPIYIQGSNQVSLQGIWGSPSNPILVAPGENNIPLTVVVENLGENLLSNVTLTLKSHYPIQFLQNNATIGFVPAGQYNYATVIADIYPNASSGVYYIPVTVSMYNGYKETVMLPVEILGYVSIQAQSLWGSINSPITVSPGETQVPLTILLKNTGDVNVLNATLTFSNSEYPLKFSQTNAQVGIIPAGQENYATVTVSVYPNATPGVYYIPATLNYYNYKTEITVPVDIYSPNVSINVVTLPPQVFPGYYDVRLLTILTNYGNGIAENASISVSTPFQVISSPEIKIGALPIGSPVNVTFLINIPNDTIPKTYTVNFTVTFDGGKANYQYALNVYPKANIIITNVKYSTINPGDSNVPITITLKNTGNATAKNVIVRLGTSDVIYPHVSSSNPLQALTASEVFVGDINPQQTANVTFVVDISGGASPGVYPLAIAATWNQTGAIFPFEQSDTFYVSISQPFLSQLFSSPLIYVIIAIIIVIIIIVVVLSRFRREK